MTANTAYLYDLDLHFGGGEAWQGALMQQIDPLTAEQASWKPAPDRHAIWDIVIHVNFWKEYMIAAARGQEKPDQEKGNWSLTPADANEANWQKELTRTRSIQEELRAICNDYGDKLYSTEDRTVNFIRQLIYHDAYHAGQIGLLRVMQGLKPVE